MNIVQQYLRKGTENARDQFDARRILMLNLFCGVGVIALLILVIQSVIVKEPLIMNVVLGAAMILMAVVLFVGRKNPMLGIASMLLLVNLIIWFFANAEGFRSGSYFYYFPLFFAYAWLLDFREKRYALLLLSVMLAGVISLAVLPDDLFHMQIAPSIRELSFTFNLILASVIMAINTLVIVWINYVRQKDLEERIAIIEKTKGQLEVALREKDVLLAEIHHRVKNNLAVIRGLLNMQLNSTTNENAKETLQESVSRVSAMALIHQKLYANINPNKIDLKSYVTELVSDVAHTFKNTKHTEPIVSIDIADVSVNLNKAVPCGLILNELLTNAYKHAFSEHADPRIAISITIPEGAMNQIQIVVEDNGSGIRADQRSESSETLGMTIIQSLSEQLDGEFRMLQGEKKGTRAILVFPNIPD